MKKNELEVVNLKIGFQEDGMNVKWSIPSAISESFTEEEKKIVNKSMEDIEKIIIGVLYNIYQDFDNNK